MKKTLFYNLLIALAALSSCQKDLDLFVPDLTGGYDSTWHNTLSNTMPVAALKTALLLPTYKDSFDLNSSSASIMTGSGLQCEFDPGSIVTSANIPVTGRVYIETQLLKTKGNMIRMGTPTISNGRLLVSGGELFIRLTQNGNELQIQQQTQQVAGAHYNIKYNDPQPSSLMKIFYGDATDPNAFNWLPNVDTSNFLAISNQPSGSYLIHTNQLNWINCDYFYDTAGIPQTNVSVVLPANYTNANSIAFIAFNDIHSVVGMYGNATTKKFSSGRLPANKEITVVVISKQGNDYFLGHTQAFTTGSSGTVNSQQVTITPVISSLANINIYLDSL